MFLSKIIGNYRKHDSISLAILIISFYFFGKMDMTTVIKNQRWTCDKNTEEFPEKLQ